jgi:tetratricopeptide (TPR) repeat protein
VLGCVVFSVTCSSCQNEIPLENSVQGTYFCACGATTRTTPGAGSSPRRRGPTQGLDIRIVVVGVLAALGYLHVANWDGYSVEIVPLKMSQILGRSSDQDLRRIADICHARAKSFCEEQALVALSQRLPQDAAVAEKVADLQMKRDGFDQAYVHLNRALAASPEARAIRGKLAFAMWKLGHKEESKKHFEYLLYSQGQTLDASVSRNYVSFLLADGEFQRARQVIEHCRSLGATAGMFLEAEYREIQKKLALTANSGLTTKNR